ncbi:PilN family type IVB pilus formation outer membrane protein (plasmid) [Enterobacter asburiae]|uniref:PilN family type IVB pilus formation outer membrane protein n=1 Tax=Enterobacter cloacae complex TaxID=354276 RepID=UPI00288981A5|nr:PilN family type IVB pilus formation outer membrane protein [Enterobacter asburiae]WNI61126.1 PilN family type IVB pilus formation outer membrane protein [Enterobacter asburiae]
MKQYSMTRVAIAIAALGLLAGCSNLQRIDETQNTAAADFDTASRKMSVPPGTQPVSEISTQWINPVPLNSKGGQELLPGCSVTLMRPGEISLADVSAFITRTCRVPVVITPDARSAAMSGGATEKISGPIPAPVPAPDATGMIPLNQMGATTLPKAVTGTDVLKGVHWQGALSGLLDHVTTRLGLSWRYEQGRIAIFYLDTRSFPITFQDSQNSFSSKSVYGTTSSSGEGSSGEGNTSQTTTTDMNTNRYKELEATVKSMLTPETGRMSIAGGMLTVTDTPRVLTAVQRYIEGRNTELTRQVVLSVKVWSVTKKRQDQLGIDWDAVFRSGSVGLSLGNTMSGVANTAMTGGLSILDGKFANSNAFIHALSQQANVSVVTQNTSATTNLNPVRVQVITQQDYISRVSTENTANVGSSTSVEKATISTGFNMTMLPYIMPASDRMELQYSISMSDDPEMQPEKVGDVTLKLPKTKMHNFAQNVILKSGQALLLSGYLQANNTANKQGVGSPGFFGLGGGYNAERGDTILVIVITPTLLG